MNIHTSESHIGIFSVTIDCVFLTVSLQHQYKGRHCWQENTGLLPPISYFLLLCCGGGKCGQTTTDTPRDHQNNVLMSSKSTVCKSVSRINTSHMCASLLLLILTSYRLILSSSIGQGYSQPAKPVCVPFLWQKQLSFLVLRGGECWELMI